MTRSKLTELIREVLDELKEANTSGSVGAYHTPFAFGRGNNRAVKALKKIGYKKQSRPKRPTSTKLIDYL